MSPRAWPTDGKTIAVVDALGPLFAVLKASRRRGAPDLAAIYCEAGGLDIGNETKETSRDVTEQIAEAPDGVEPIWKRVEARLLLVAFQLGTEQGRRIEARAHGATYARARRLCDETEKAMADLQVRISRLEAYQEPRDAGSEPARGGTGTMKDTIRAEDSKETVAKKLAALIVLLEGKDLDNLQGHAVFNNPDREALLKILRESLNIVRGVARGSPGKSSPRRRSASQRKPESGGNDEREQGQDA